MNGQMIITNKGIKNELDYLIEKAIDRLLIFEPAEGYYLAFSGGKDSIVIYDLAKRANVKFKANYNVTSVDPPELIYFIRDYYDVKFNQPKNNETMWQLIVRKRMPPTRMVRYCCSSLKEHGGDSKFCVTGVRWSESDKRKKNRDSIELNAYSKYINKINDNVEGRRHLETCVMRSKHILNPIVGWTDEHVWEYIRKYNLKYCKLYDMGFKRLGCIGCPIASKKNRLMEFEMWPKFKDAYIRTFQRMVDKRKIDGLETNWNTGQEVFDWWIQ